MKKATAEIELEILLEGIDGIADALRRAADNLQGCKLVHKGLAVYLVDQAGRDIGAVAMFAGARDMTLKDAA